LRTLLDASPSADAFERFPHRVDQPQLLQDVQERRRANEPAIGRQTHCVANEPSILKQDSGFLTFRFFAKLDQQAAGVDADASAHGNIR